MNRAARRRLVLREPCLLRPRERSQGKSAAAGRLHPMTAFLLMNSSAVKLLGLYLHLARASKRRLRPHVTDRLLLLAGVIAARMQLPEVSDTCRKLILQHNPNHLIRRWPSFQLALEHSDFLHLLKQLQRRYPQEKAERMLDGLGITLGREWETYYSVEEYAESLLEGFDSPDESPPSNPSSES